MVEITIKDDLVIFEIKNNGIKDLKDFYTMEYFTFLDTVQLDHNDNYDNFTFRSLKISVQKTKMKILDKNNKKHLLNHQDEIITLKMKKNGKIQSFIDIIDENKRLYQDDIEMNKDGLFYQDVETIVKIQNYLQMEIFQNEIFQVNNKYIIIKDNEIQEESFDRIDTSKMENTLVSKLCIAKVERKEEI